jgi:hypothetical protein
MDKEQEVYGGEERGEEQPSNSGSGGRTYLRPPSAQIA